MEFENIISKYYEIIEGNTSNLDKVLNLLELHKQITKLSWKYIKKPQETDILEFRDYIQLTWNKLYLNNLSTHEQEEADKYIYR